MTKQELIQDVDKQLAEIRELCMSVIDKKQDGVEALDLVAGAARFLKGHRDTIAILRGLETLVSAFQASKPDESTDKPAPDSQDSTVVAFKAKGSKSTH